jgi:exonuclease III
MVFPIFFVVFAVLSILGSKSDTECPVVSFIGEAKTSGFRIVQYNAEWLFMDYYEPMKCPGSGCTWANETEADIHFQYVAKVVSELQPDIINICEVEGCDELNLLRNRIVDGETYQTYLKKGTDTATGQNVGLLTKWSPNRDLMRTEEKMEYPLEGSMCGYVGEGGTVGVSKHYITEYTLYGRPTLFIGLHLLAYPEDVTRCAEREAQSQIIQNVIIDYLMSTSGEVIVLGDLNDFDGRVLDANRNMPTSRVLDILKGLDGEYRGKYELKTVAEKIPQVERFSDWWDQNVDCVSTANEFSMIDSILVTPFLLDKVKTAFVYHGYDEFCGKYDSDHYPLVVDFS